MFTVHADPELSQKLEAEVLRKLHASNTGIKKIAELMHRPSDSMSRGAYLRFIILRRQFRGKKVLGLAFAVKTGRTLVRQAKTFKLSKWVLKPARGLSL